MKRKLFSILLSLAMVVTMMPAMASISFADSAKLSSFKVIFKNASGTVINEAKPGAKLTAEVYLGEGTYTSATVGLSPNTDPAVKFTNIVGANGISFTEIKIDSQDGSAKANFSNEAGVSIGTSPFFTIDVTVPSGASKEL